MPDPLAIKLENVSKVYRLYGSQRAQLLDVIGLTRLGFGSSAATKEFVALKDITLDVPRGKRIGIVGRNGAGKTTLLKLICGNFAPTSGTISVKGRVQALLSMGVGFHPDHTGRENVHASLQYNGLARSEYQAAMAEIIDFCELGQFIDQPFKTYSLGMQGRLMFAAATAIKPEILIIDEVLGAGDAYFVAKSKQRVDQLVNSGCTMLLVSHGMSTILELCEDAVWLDSGNVRMQGDAFRVVKAFEEEMHGPIKHLSSATAVEGLPKIARTVPTQSAGSAAANQHFAAAVKSRARRDEIRLQEPTFLPHADSVDLPAVSISEARTMPFQAPGGVSRWASEEGVKVCGFSIVTAKGVGNTIRALQPARFVFFLIAEYAGRFDCRYGIVLNDLMGNVVNRIYSPPDSFSIESGELRRIEMTLNPNQLGPGDYIVGITVLENCPLEKVNSTRRFDLIARSFLLKVEIPDSMSTVTCAFFQSAEWSFCPSAAAD